MNESEKAFAVYVGGNRFLVSCSKDTPAELVEKVRARLVGEQIREWVPVDEPKIGVFVGNSPPIPMKIVEYIAELEARVDKFRACYNQLLFINTMLSGGHAQKIIVAQSQLHSEQAALIAEQAELIAKQAALIAQAKVDPKGGEQGPSISGEIPDTYQRKSGG